MAERMVLVSRTWHGDEFVARSKRANARAAIGMGEAASVEMKTAAHEISGDLKRSVHQARTDTMGEVHANQTNIEVRENLFRLEVGSWLPYACVENNRGGSHRFADIGWQAALPTRWAKLHRAWREEGL